MELKGKAAIITGSARGIGAGIAVAFGREGANVVVNGLSAESCQDTVKQITGAGGKAIAVGADVSKAADVEAMVAAATKQFGGVDILVNNAGIERAPVLLHEMSEQQWDLVLGINLKGVFLCCKAVLPLMIAKGKGKIVNIASTAGIRMTFFGSGDYTASKHGVTGLTQHLVWEVADHNSSREGMPTAVDRQIGLGYGAAAVRAICENQTGVLVAFQPPDLKFVPIAEAINKVRTVPFGSVFVQIARSLGIALGD